SVRDEAVYSPPEEAGESTKAIPIITDEQLNGTDDDATLVHNEHETTKHAPDQPNDGNEDSKKPKKKKRFYKRKWFIFVMLICLIIVGGMNYFVMRTHKMMHMRDVVNEEYEDAKETLEEKQVKENKKMMASEEVEEVIVKEAEPEANHSVK